MYVKGLPSADRWTKGFYVCMCVRMSLCMYVCVSVCLCIGKRPLCMYVCMWKAFQIILCKAFWRLPRAPLLEACLAAAPIGSPLDALATTHQMALRKQPYAPPLVFEARRHPYFCSSALFFCLSLPLEALHCFFAPPPTVHMYVNAFTSSSYCFFAALAFSS